MVQGCTAFCFASFPPSSTGLNAGLNPCLLACGQPNIQQCRTTCTERFTDTSNNGGGNNGGGNNGGGNNGGGNNGGGNNGGGNNGGGNNGAGNNRGGNKGGGNKGTNKRSGGNNGNANPTPLIAQRPLCYAACNSLCPFGATQTPDLTNLQCCLVPGIVCGDKGIQTVQVNGRNFPLKG
jgi:hypothetical protein